LGSLHNNTKKDLFTIEASIYNKMTKEDKAWIAQLKSIYDLAKEQGDVATMDAAHAEAAKIREKYDNNYSKYDNYVSVTPQGLLFVNKEIPPPPEVGYIPPKGKPSGVKGGKVKNPNGEGWGFPAKDGGVWVPKDDTGKNKQHGGEGWTVQYPDGSHEHRYPSGHIRLSVSDILNPNIVIAVGQVITYGAEALLIVAIIGAIVILSPVGI